MACTHVPVNIQFKKTKIALSAAYYVRYTSKCNEDKGFLSSHCLLTDIMGLHNPERWTSAKVSPLKRPARGSKSTTQPPGRDQEEFKRTNVSKSDEAG